MANPTKKSGARKSRGSEKASVADRRPSGRPSDAPNIQRLFEDAHYAYAQALREAQVQAHQGVAEAIHNYLREQQAIQADAQRRSWEVYLDYVKASHDALEKNDLKAADEARRDYEEALKQVHRESQQRYLDAYESYLRALADASSQENVQENVEEAYRKYLKDLQKAWAQVNVDSLDPHSLAAISQSVEAAALSLSGASGHSAAAS